MSERKQNDGGPATMKSNGIGDFHVICTTGDAPEEDTGCGASTSDYRCEEETQAARRWNRRAALDVPAGEREELAQWLLDRLDEDDDESDVGEKSRRIAQLLRTQPAVTEAMVEAASEALWNGTSPLCSWAALTPATSAQRDYRKIVRKVLQAAQAQRTGEDDNG